MKRTPRYIFNTITVVSLLLMLGTVGLWVDSYWFSTVYTFRSESLTTEYHLFNGPLGVGVGLLSGEIHPPGVFGPGWDQQRQSNDWLAASGWSNPNIPTLLGFHLRLNYPIFGGIAHSSQILVPHWFLTLIFAILPAIWLLKWNKRRKLAPNACPGCGYDLTGNESGVCPECGVGASEMEPEKVE